MPVPTKNCLAFDASLLTCGAVAVLAGRLAAAATFRHDRGTGINACATGLEKYAAITAAQAADVRAFLDDYSREVPVIIEAPANADGTVWQKHSTFAVTLGAGVVAGVALALGFSRVEFVAAGHGGWGGKTGKNAWLARTLPGAELKTEHEFCAAAMACYWLAKQRD